jgi:hypothetical protein
VASCTKCGATLIAKARFCATCGSPVAAAPSAPPPAPGGVTTQPATDPFAKTVFKDDPSPPRVDLPPPAVSPMAASVMSTPQVPVRPSQSPPAYARAPEAPAAQPQTPAPSVKPPPPMPQGAPAGYIGTPWNIAPVAPPPAARQPPQGPTQYQPPVNAASHAFAPGALVLVYWADGNRYPGTILQVSQHHVFVVFPNGTQQWVDARYVTQGP